MPPFAGKRQKIFMTALSAADLGKPIMEHPAVQKPIDHFLDVRAEKTVSLFSDVVPSGIIIRVNWSPIKGLPLKGPEPWPIKLKP